MTTYLNNIPVLGPDHGPAAREAVGVLCDVGEGRVLLQLRDDVAEVEEAGRWCFFGGGRDPGEALADTAAREFEEETGLTFPAANFTPFCAVYAPPRQSLVIYVFRIAAKITPAQVTVLEGCGFGMFNQRQVRHIDFIPHLKQVLNAHYSAEVFATE